MGIFDTNVTWYSATESCVITSETMGGSDGMDIAATATIYSGACDFQPADGDTFTDPAGQVQIIDAHLIIDPDANGNLPAIVITDGGARYSALINGVAYSVVFANVWAAPPAHMELVLKRGPGSYKARA